MRFSLCTLLLLAIAFPLGVQSGLFFPEEVVSLLSFVYSILPPFKVGKDSRIGAGFRVGPNADFQVLIELGPQSETQPIGPGAGSKRDARANANGQGKQRKGNPRKSLKKMKSKTELTTTAPSPAPKLDKQNSTKLPLQEALNSTKREITN